MSIRVRFAPSPTGSLHLGVVRTAIFNYLFSKKNKGKLILRIEDTDKERSTNDSFNEIISNLSWLGIDWDEGPIKQSDRLDIYDKFASLLISEGKAYRCYASQDEINLLKEKAKLENKIYRYPRIWRDKTERPSNQEYVVRFKTPDNEEVEFKDSLRGKISINSSNIDDFIILKSDGFPTYNFASSIDDIEMGITNVIRGEDHLSNTPKQVLIFNALKKNIPEFTHVSMILGKDKTKLSKRHGAESIQSFKDKGFLPISIINYLTRLGWSHGDQEIFALDELKELFTIDNLNKSPAVFDIEKFKWVNSSHIKNISNSELIKRLDISLIPDVDVEKALTYIKEKSGDINQIRDSLKFCETHKILINEDLLNSVTKDQKEILSNFSNFYNNASPKTVEQIKDSFNEFLNLHNLKMKELAFPLRIILTGSKKSPGIFEILDILGVKIVIERIKEYC